MNSLPVLSLSSQLHSAECSVGIWILFCWSKNFLLAINIILLNKSKVSKVKCTLVQALRLCTGRMAHRGSRGIALPFLDHGTRRGWGVSLTPRPFLSPGKTRYPLYRRLGGPQGRSGQVRKISSPRGFDPRTVQPVASRYNDYATRPKVLLNRSLENMVKLQYRETS